ncbi:MAG: hypothetical protein AB1556_15650, partial [Bacillota bacterium]
SGRKTSGKLEHAKSKTSLYAGRPSMSIGNLKFFHDGTNVRGLERTGFARSARLRAGLKSSPRRRLNDI